MVETKNEKYKIGSFLTWNAEARNLGSFFESVGRAKRDINRIPANAAYMRQENGVLFFKGWSSHLKNGTKTVLLRHDTSPFKGTCFLIKLKQLPSGLYGPYLCCY
jgi:hypothetical protein